jgi:glycosyltransferase involved in cell wall biosynthesis
MLLYRATDPLADQLTAVSSAAAERFVQQHAVPTRKMRVLTNGIDTEAFAPDRARRRRMRNQMQAGSKFIWLAVGRIAPAKDYPNLLQAFAQVHKTNPNTRLWIAGEGDSSKLALNSQKTSDNSSVVFLGLRRDIPDLLDAADGFVLSSAWEGMPLAVAEAMAMEKVVVATDVGGVRELVGEAGHIVPAKDSAALAEAMLGAIKQEEMERRFKGRDARTRIQLQFSMNAKAAEWEQLYMQILPGQIPGKRA